LKSIPIIGMMIVSISEEKNSSAATKDKKNKTVLILFLRIEKIPIIPREIYEANS
jgi:hypothetical protein